MKITLLFFICLLLVLPKLAAQQDFLPGTMKRGLQAQRLQGEISVDGKLDEEDWKRAFEVSDLVQIEPYQGNPSAHTTTIRAIYDEKNLYFGIFCGDSLGKAAVRVPDMKRDFNWRAHDTFAICIDGFNDERNSISFATNPYGAQKDYLSFDDIFFDGDWNGLWKVRTSITDEGWFAEFEIPWKTLRYPEVETDSTQSWGVNFLRLRRASNEISVWSPYPRSFGFNRMPYAGKMHNIQPPPPSTNIQVNPYGLMSYRSLKEGETAAEQYKLKAGGEIKWAINTNMVMDLTMNTDFAQADADVQVNNVTRFSVLFPERRQFFLENASLFGVGLTANSSGAGGDMQILPFFSRRIGLSSDGSPIPIDAGIRLVNRSAKRNYGLMAVRQQSVDTIGAANFVVARYAENIGKQNRIGFIGTMKHVNDGGGYSNYVGGIDGFFRMSVAQSLNIMMLQSSNTDGRGRGAGGYVQYYHSTNRFNAWVTGTVITKDFKPEAGFVSRTDAISISPGVFANLRGKHLPFRKWVRSYQPAVVSAWYHQASTGKLTERDIRVYPLYFEMQDGGYYGFSVSTIHQQLLTPFAPLGVNISEGVYDYLRYI
ncbi:MAG: DUF5916 domain-containing protein, partial [Bacteroidota bacterium]